MPIMTLDEAIGDITGRVGEDELEQLARAAEVAAELTDLSDSLLTHFVDRCRRAGHSWAHIGTSLGVTRQAVQKRFVVRDDGVPKDPVDERWTDRNRDVLVHAERIARRLGHTWIGTEHLLLGLLEVPDGIAATALMRLGIERSSAEAEILARVPRIDQKVSGQIRRTPRAAHVLTESAAEARRMGHGYVGTEHLLLALFVEPEGVGAEVLRRHGADRRRIRSTVIELLSGFHSA